MRESCPASCRLSSRWFWVGLVAVPKSFVPFSDGSCIVVLTRSAARGFIGPHTKAMIQQVPKPDHKIGMHRRFFTLQAASDGPTSRTGVEGQLGHTDTPPKAATTCGGGSGWPPISGILAIRC
jgi:hypothetical protein